MTERKKGDTLTFEEVQAAQHMANQLTAFSAQFDVGVTFLAMALIVANNAEDRDELDDMTDFINNLAHDVFDDLKASQA